MDDLPSEREPTWQGGGWGLSGRERFHEQWRPPLSGHSPWHGECGKRDAEMDLQARLKPIKPSDWLLEHDGWYDRAEDGAYLVIPRQERAVRPGWRHSGNEYYPGGRRRLPEQLTRAIAWRNMDKALAQHPGLQYLTVGHRVILPAVIICPRCGTRSCAEPPFDLEPYWRKRAAELRAARAVAKL